MRYCGIVFILLLFSCKPVQPTATATYKEDLSVHRPANEAVNEPIDTTDYATEQTYVPLQGHIKSELDSIVRISAAQNREGKLIDGFSIQLYTGRDRGQANEIKNRFKSYFPELKPQINYIQPNFRVKAGRFTDRLKAYRVFEEVKQEFPRSLLVPERFALTYE